MRFVSGGSSQRADVAGGARSGPDQVVSSLIDQDRRAVIGALAEHRASLKNPPKSPDEFLENLERQGLSRTVELLRNFASSL